MMKLLLPYRSALAMTRTATRDVSYYYLQKSFRAVVVVVVVVVVRDFSLGTAVRYTRFKRGNHYRRTSHPLSTRSPD